MVTMMAESRGSLAGALVDQLLADPAALRRLGEALRAIPTVEAPTVLEPAFLGVAEAARMAGCHPQTVRRAIRSGALDAGRCGRGWRIRPAAVEAWLRAGSPAPAGSATAPRPRSRRKASAGAMAAALRSLDTAA